ncbi:hypothetical protein HZI73_15600 [Vallitalea pronyensis]|uniref:Fibronectin type-III domain-containing protein n=1 Tax=Vallitalea pronyensis TaxID=1348613 RepID=A0A8J8MLB5_9FIRM|nr:fibronectin type III domain-containing protein [Vallitalea pronyensis]QUI23626.1 hypothetical protein HZI73_15600 [Vallitalea pronyensis]
MKKYRRILSLILLVALMIVNSLTVLGTEGELDKWTVKASMPTPRDSFGVAEVNGKIYAIGGYSGTEFTTIVEEYDPATDLWTTKANMPTPRIELGEVEVNGKIYAIGGYSGTEFIAKVEEYDPTTDTWTTKANMPTPRNRLEVVGANGKIYAIGGRTLTNGTMATVEEYDPATDTWTTKANMPTKRSAFGIAEVGGKIYAIGGYNPTNAIIATVEEYDSVTDKWTTKASMPTKRQDLGVEEVNGKIYAFGGFSGIDGITTVEEYDPVTDTWTAKVNMTAPRFKLKAAEVGGGIYVIGGETLANRMQTIVEVFMSSSTEVVSPTNLTATSNSNSIVLNWDTVTDAYSYTILRSTDSGTIDTVIASDITGTTYTDTNVTPGVTCYYVVRAVKNGVESANSNVASTMIEISNNRALLLIKLLGENDKEYDLPMSDVDTFMSWYFDRGVGQGPAYYTFTKDYNAGPYISREDYISYDKIICIEVNEYIK